MESALTANGKCIMGYYSIVVWDCPKFAWKSANLTNVQSGWEKSQFLALKLFLYDLAISVFFKLKRLDSLKCTSKIWKCAVIGLNFLTACFTRRFWRIMHDEAFPKTSAWEAISKNSYVRHHCLQSCFCYSALKRVVRSACRCMSIASNTHAEVTCWY